MASPVVQVRVPAGLLARMDEHRGEVSRSAWIVAACEAALEPKWASGGIVARVPDGSDSVPAVLLPGDSVVAPWSGAGSPHEHALEVEHPVPVGPMDPGDVAEPASPKAERTVHAKGQKPVRCTHPGTRVIGGFCKPCDALVGPGGVIRYE